MRHTSRLIALGQLADPSFRVRVEALGTKQGRDYFLDWIPVRVTFGP